MKLVSVSIFILFLNTALFTPTYAIESDIISNEHYYLLLKNFLNLDDENFQDSDGLKEWYEWDSFTSKILNKKRLTLDETKIYMFIVMIVDARLMVATSEHLTATIVNRFNHNRDNFLKVLQESPFFIPFITRQISGALHERKQSKLLNDFLKKNEKIILKSLGERSGNDFINMLKNPKDSSFYY